MKKLLLLPTLLIAFTFTLVMAEAKAVPVSIQASGDGAVSVFFDVFFGDPYDPPTFTDAVIGIEWDLFSIFDSDTNSGSAFLSLIGTDNFFPLDGLYQTDNFMVTNRIIVPSTPSTQSFASVGLSGEFNDVFNPANTLSLGLSLVGDVNDLLNLDGSFRDFISTTSIDDGILLGVIDDVDPNLFESGFSSSPDGFFGFGRNQFVNIDVQDSVDVPEPTSMALMGLGLLGLVGMRKKKST